MLPVKCNGHAVILNLGLIFYLVKNQPKHNPVLSIRGISFTDTQVEELMALLEVLTSPCVEYIECLGIRLPDELRNMSCFSFIFSLGYIHLVSQISINHTVTYGSHNSHKIILNILVITF